MRNKIKHKTNKIIGKSKDRRDHKCDYVAIHGIFQSIQLLKMP